MIVLAAACLWPAQALAGIPAGNTTDPLQRSALLSLGSIYRVETTVSVPALRTNDGSGRTYPLGRIHDVTLLGTAFAVMPTGVLVTDAHVAAPFGGSLAVAAAPLALAQIGQFGDEPAYQSWVNAHDVVPVGARVVALRVWRATASPAVSAGPVPAHLVPNSVEVNPDLALIQLDAGHTVPALTVNEGETIATPIVTIGYGTGTPTTLGLPDTLVPSLKTGQLGGTGPITPAPGQPNPAKGQLLTYISAPIAHGDSGGAAIDGYPNGQVHGVVRFPDGSGGLIEPSQAIFDLLRREHFQAPTSGGPVYDAFATGMKDMWSGNYAGAQAAFTQTLAADPTHPLAAQEQRLAAVLARSKPAAGRPAWWRILFACIAIAAAGAALACVWRLRRLHRAHHGHDDTAAQVPPAQ
jgi:Trypsin-like peptidase domain